jgi:lipoprotein-anchoring transpeptidase ErfK/SrfK
MLCLSVEKRKSKSSNKLQKRDRVMEPLAGSVLPGIGNEFNVRNQRPEKQLNPRKQLMANVDVLRAGIQAEADAVEPEATGGVMSITQSGAILAYPHHRLRIKLPSPKAILASMLISIMIITGIFLRQTLVSETSTIYSTVYDHIALLVKPMSSLSSVQLRLPTTAVNDKVASIESQNVAISMGTTVLHPSRQIISSWISQSHDYYGQTVLTASQKAITTYLNNNIEKLTKTPVEEVSVTHPDGSSAVLQSGSNGTKFPNPSSLSGKIGQQLLSGNGVSFGLPAVSTPYIVSNQPASPKVLEVDTTTKQMYAYQNGVLIKTFLTTDGAPATPTPLGTFYIWEKIPVETMTGFNLNGTRYVQPNVQWINYFDHSGDAIHGNYWRPLSYFGNINSSHGCVGVVNSDAEWIYDWAPIGTKVIIHS